MTTLTGMVPQCLSLDDAATLCHNCIFHFYYVCLHGDGWANARPGPPLAMPVFMGRQTTLLLQQLFNPGFISWLF